MYRGTDIKSEHSHKSWRPLTTISFALHRKLAGTLDPKGFHAVNIGLHTVASLLVLLVSQRVIKTLSVTDANVATAGDSADEGQEGARVSGSRRRYSATDSQLNAAGTSPGGFTRTIRKRNVKQVVGKNGNASSSRRLRFGGGDSGGDATPSNISPLTDAAADFGALATAVLFAAHPM